MPSTASSSIHRQAIVDGIGEDLANAIDGRIDEKIKIAFDDHKHELRGIIDEQVRISSEAQALPPEQRRQVAPAVNDANQSVRTAVADTNDIAARERAGERIDPSEYERAEQERESARVQQADADRRLASAQRVREDHERQTSTSASSRSASGSTAMRTTAPPTRPVTDPDVFGQIEEINRRLDDHDTVAAHTYSTARASLIASNVWQKAAWAALGTFVVVFVLYFMFWLITSMEWDTGNALGMSFGFAGIMAAIVFVLGSSNRIDEYEYIDVRNEAVGRREQYEAERRHDDQRHITMVDSRRDDHHSDTRQVSRTGS